MIVVLENKDYLESTMDPYLQELGSKGAVFTNFHGIAHPSYQNYLAMIGGKKFFAIPSTQRNLNEPTVADLLEAKGLTWKSYAQGFPGDCFLGKKTGLYVRRHVPFLSFKPITENPERCANIVDGEQFQVDYAAKQLPNYVFYTPDQDNNGHDTTLAYATRWLRGFLEPLLADSEFMSETLIQVTFDESRRYTHNHILNIFLGGMVDPGVTITLPYTHYNVLRTIEENWNLDTLGKKDRDSIPIEGLWR